KPRVSIREGVPYQVEQELLQLYEGYPNSAAALPPPIRVKTGIPRGLDHKAYPGTFHRSFQRSPRAPRVILGNDEYHRSDVMFLAPGRKDVAFLFGPRVRPGDLHDIRHAQRP